MNMTGLQSYFIFNETGPTPATIVNYCIQTGSPSCNFFTGTFRTGGLSGSGILYDQIGNGVLPNTSINFTTPAREAGAFGSGNTLNWMNDGSHDWTVNFWYAYRGYVNGTVPQGIIFTNKYLDGHDTKPYFYIAKFNDLFCAAIGTSFQSNTIESCTEQHISNDPQWHMFTAIYHHTGMSSTDTMSVYVDGLLTNTENGNNNSYQNNAIEDYVIGNQWCGPFGQPTFWSCGLHEFDAAKLTQMSVWSRDLSFDEVSQLWNSGSGISLLPSPQTVTYSINGLYLQNANTAFITECYTGDNLISTPNIISESLYRNDQFISSYMFPNPIPLTTSTTCPHTFLDNPLFLPSTYNVTTIFDTPPFANNGIGSFTATSGNMGNGTNGGSQGSINWISHRVNDFRTLILTIFRTPVPYNMNCDIINGTFNQVSHWFSFHNVSSANITASVPAMDQAYFICYDNSNTTVLFSGESFGNETPIHQSTTVFNNSFGAIIGIPAGMFVICLIASLANARTGPIYVIITLGFAGILSVIGFITLSTGFWALALIAGMLGILVGRKIF